MATRGRRGGGGARLAAMAVMGILALAPAGVQGAVQSEQAQVRAFEIAAQPLVDALVQFGLQSGLHVSADAGRIRGIGSPGVRGEMSAGQALTALLAGTGFTFRMTDARTAILEPAPADDAVRLGAVRVQGEGGGREGLAAGATTDPAATEGTGSYTTGSLAAATRMALSIRETPQSVTVITRDRMDDQAMIKAGDALQNTPGLAATSISGPNREVYYARGFLVQNYTFDGLPATFSTAGGQALVNDLSMYDRVEVVRGATGLTQGVGTPSAAINFVRKRPTAERQASVRGRAGSWGHLGIEGDVSGPIAASGKVRARAVVNGWASDSFMDVAGEDRQMVYGILEADLTDRTLLSASASFLNNDNNTTYSGLPTARDGADLGLPRSTYLGNTWNYWDETNTSAFASLEQRFGAGWTLTVALNQIWGRQNRFVTGINMNESDRFDQTGNEAGIANDRTSYDVHATGPFRLFGREHQLVVGGGGRRARDTNDTAGYWPPIYLARDMDVFDWGHDAPEPAVTQDYHYRGREQQYGGYATARLQVADPLRVIVGLRVDAYDFESSDDIYDWDADSWTLYTGGYDYRGHLTKYAGLVYDVDGRHSVYASYTDIFQPQDARGVDNQFIVPILGRNYEAGVKGEYLAGALNVSGAVYLVDQDHLAMPVGECPFNPLMTCYRAAGVVRSHGVDLEVQGALAANWQIGGGYGFVSTEVREDADPAAIGTRLNTNLPRGQVKLFTSYRFGGHWTAGGNLRWQSAIYHSDDWAGYRYQTAQAAYGLVDLVAGYRHSEKLDVQVNVTNLFDRTYFREINTQPVEWGGNALYGAPRRVMLTVRCGF